MLVVNLGEKISVSFGPLVFNKFLIFPNFPFSREVAVKFSHQYSELFQISCFVFKMREIVSIQVGNCGNKVGQRVSRFPQIFFHFNLDFRDSSGKPSLTSTTSTGADISMAIPSFHISGLTFITKADRKRFSSHEQFSAIWNRRR